LAFGGLILSDDLEMKAVADGYSVPSAAVLAIDAGCDGLLICSADHARQASALEALIHAVEDERLRESHVNGALKRQLNTKERFLSAPVTARPRSPRELRRQV